MIRKKLIAWCLAAGMVFSAVPGSGVLEAAASESLPGISAQQLSGEIEVREEHVLRENSDGSENDIYGKLYAPKEEGKYPAIILSHGYNGTNNDWVNECTYYAQNGYVAYAFDFCGGSNASKSEGRSTDMTVGTEVADLIAVLEHISDLENVDEKNVFLMGGSQGGLVTALTAAEQSEKVSGVLLYFPALCIHDDWVKKYKSLEEVPETQDFWGLQLGKGFVEYIWDLDVFSLIGEYDKDVLIFHGDQDAIVPLSYSERAKEIYDSAELIVYPGEGHGFTPDTGKKAMQSIKEFMGERVAYEVSFETNGGGKVKSQSVKRGKKAKKPVTPDREGYTFVGWYADAGFEKEFSFDSKITEHTTVYAKWEKKPEETPKVTTPATPETSDGARQENAAGNVTAPQKTGGVSVKNNKKKSLQVKWKKVSNVKGYEVQYAYDSKFTKNRKTKKVQTNSVTLKKLKKGKICYVRVRPYRQDASGNKIYGDWSKAKKIKIKK
jgi:hypothetical protein